MLRSDIKIFMVSLTIVLLLVMVFYPMTVKAAAPEQGSSDHLQKISDEKAGSVPKTVPAAGPSLPAVTAPSSVNPIAQAAVKAGVLSCVSRINQVCTFLLAGVQKWGVCQFIPPSEPDRNIYSISMEKQGTDEAFAYASASFAPNQASGCGGTLRGGGLVAHGLCRCGKEALS